jgi:hypothetical protein
MADTPFFYKKELQCRFYPILYRHTTNMKQWVSINKPNRNPVNVFDLSMAVKTLPFPGALSVFLIPAVS